MPNLDTMGHRWVGALTSFQFELKYQKGADNGAADTLSQVPSATASKLSSPCLREQSWGIVSSGGEAGAHAQSGLETGPGGRYCPSLVPQVAPPQEGCTTTQARYPPQGVPWSGNRDRTGQDVLPYLQQSHPE